MSVVEDKKSIKKRRLLDAAYDQFIKKSVNSTAIDDVVKAAGVAKGTFYLYFRDKYDLLNQIVAGKSADVICEAYDEVCMVDKQHVLSFTDSVICFIDILITKMQSNKEILTLIDKNLSACLRTLTSLPDERLQDVIARLLGEFMNNGFSLDGAKKTIYLLVDMVGSVCSDAIIYSRPYGINDIKPTLLAAVASIISRQRVEEVLT